MRFRSSVGWGLVALLGGCMALPAPAGTADTPAIAASKAVPAPAASVAINWDLGVTGLGFHDYFRPSLGRWDLQAPAPGDVVVYRVVGRQLAATGIVPGYRALGNGWAFDFHTPADGKSRRATPGSGLPWLVSELNAPEDRFQPTWVLDRAAATVDSVAAAKAVAGDPAGDLALISAGEYQALTGKNATAPVWRIAVKPAGFAYVDAATGAVLAAGS